jgi:hypothetical protein
MVLAGEFVEVSRAHSGGKGSDTVEVFLANVAEEVHRGIIAVFMGVNALLLAG